jgi:hypothetical protein
LTSLITTPVRGLEAGLSICREDCMNSDGHRTRTLPLIVVLRVITAFDAMAILSTSENSTS